MTSLSDVIIWRIFRLRVFESIFLFHELLNCSWESILMLCGIVLVEVAFLLELLWERVLRSGLYSCVNLVVNSNSNLEKANTYVTCGRLLANYTRVWSGALNSK